MPNYTCPSWSQGASCLLGMSACVFLTPIFLQITRLAVRETFLESSAGPKGQGGTGLRRKEGALALPFSVLPSPEMQSLIVLQLQFTVGLTQDLAPCVLRPNPVSDTHSDLRSSFHAQVQISQVVLPPAPGWWQVKVSATGSSTSIPEAFAVRAPRCKGGSTDPFPVSGMSAFCGLSPAQVHAGDGRRGLWSLWGSAGPKPPSPHLWRTARAQGWGIRLCPSNSSNLPCYFGPVILSLRALVPSFVKHGCPSLGVVGKIQ